MKRGSALLMALWIIAVLAVMVLSFAAEAHLYTGLNVWVRERNRLNRLIEPGRILAEIVLIGYKDVKEPEINNGEEDWDDVFEDEDRWCKEKYALKKKTRCTIGPILLDDEDPDSGVITVDIDLVNSGSEHAININKLYDGGDKNYLIRWQQILENCGIPDDLEVEVEEADGRTTKKRNLMNHLIACWNDWRKGNETSSRGPIQDDGDIESQEGDGAGVGEGDGNDGHYYYEYYTRIVDEQAHGTEDRKRLWTQIARYPKAGEEHEITKIEELELIRGFKDFPSVLTGGYLYDGSRQEDEFKKERGTEENPMLQGIVNFFGVSGSLKNVINDKTTVDQLCQIPGIFQVSGNSDDDSEDTRELAEAILAALWIPPEDVDTRPYATSSDGSGKKWWPYKDISDINQRLEDTYNGSVSLGDEISSSIETEPSDTSVFKVTIIGRSMGMDLKVTAECYVKDKKVRYIKWSEPAVE